MLIEEKTAEPEQTEEQNTEAETETEIQEEEDESEAKQKENIQLDYEAELERERKHREAAEKAAADATYKLREQRRKEKEMEFEEEDDEENKPLTRAEFRTVLLQERQQIRKDLQQEIIAEKATKLAGSEVEANLIVEIYKNRIFPEGLSLDEQLEEAYAIANRKKIMAQNEELKRSLRSKETISDNIMGTHRDSIPIGEPKMSSNDIQAIKAAGFVWDSKIRLFVKQLSGGKKILTYNPKTKTQKVIEK